MRALVLILVMVTGGAALAQQAADTVAPEGAGAGVLQVPARLAAAQAAKDAGQPVEA